MTKLRALSSALRVSAAALSLSLSSATIVGSVAVTVLPAYAQAVTITADQAAGIQANLQTAINAVNAQGLTGAALTTALQNAIAQVEVNAVALYGAGAAGSITSAVLAAPVLASMSASIIGNGLGQAAATVSRRDGLAAATAIATTVRDEGPSGSQTTFASAESAAGGPTSVADAAGGSPNAAGATGGQGNNGNANGNGNGNGGGNGRGNNGNGNGNGGSGGGGGCANPSCT